MFNFKTFEDGRVYFSSFAIHSKHVGNMPSEVIGLIGAFDDVKDIETFCTGIARNFALNNEIPLSMIKKDTIMTVERFNGEYVVVSYTFETEKDSPLGSIYNTLEIHFAL